MRKSISRLLELEGFNVRAFGDPEDFLNEMATNRIRLVVLDIWMERMTGMELLAHLCARSPETRVIFITGHEDRAAEATVMRAGAAGFSSSPWITKDLSLPFETPLSKHRDWDERESAPARRALARSQIAVMPDNPTDDSEAFPGSTTIPEPAHLWQYSRS
jgi:Response regulator